MTSAMKFGPELMRQAGVLAGFTGDAPRITRTYLSPEHKQAGEYLIGLMRDAGMDAGFDVSFTIDLRSGDDATRRRAVAALRAQFSAIAAQGIEVRHLRSGAGHDAMVFPAVCATAMLFVRCGNNGISHHPDEIMTTEDAEVSTRVLLDFFENLELSLT